MIRLFINSMTSGGAEKVVLTLLDRFQAAQQEVQLICIEHEQFYDVPESASVQYLSTHQSMENSWQKIPFLFFGARRLKKMVVQQKIPIVQSHLLRASFINVIARWMGSSHHAQVVLHSRINFDHKPWWYQIVAKYLYKKILHRADSVVSICQSMKIELDDYLDLRKHPAHHAIYNPHDLADIRQKAKAHIADFKFQKETDYIISVGRLVPGKRLDDLVHAFAALQHSKPNTALLFIGEGPEQAKLQALSAQLHVKEKVHFLGYQQNPFAYIARSQILVLSSEWEGLPNVLIEALACRTAVVSSDCISGPREILHPTSNLTKQLSNQWEKGSYGFLYPVGKWQLLKECLERLLSNSEERMALVAAGEKRAQEFEATGIAHQYLKSFGLVAAKSTSCAEPIHR
ncbi:MAG: glycosyltransferase [Bacteroidota bacterium]